MSEAANINLQRCWPAKAIAMVAYSRSKPILCQPNRSDPIRATWQPFGVVANPTSSLVATKGKAIAPRANLQGARWAMGKPAKRWPNAFWPSHCSAGCCCCCYCCCSGWLRNYSWVHNLISNWPTGATQIVSTYGLAVMRDDDTLSYIAPG